MELDGALDRGGGMGGGEGSRGGNGGGGGRMLKGNTGSVVAGLEGPGVGGTGLSEMGVSDTGRLGVTRREDGDGSGGRGTMLGCVAGNGLWLGVGGGAAVFVLMLEGGVGDAALSVSARLPATTATAASNEFMAPSSAMIHTLRSQAVMQTDANCKAKQCRAM